MTYEGISTVLFRFAGLIMIIGVVLTVLPTAASAPGGAAQTAWTGGITMLPGVIFILASKPLGKIMAAGLE